MFKVCITTYNRPESLQLLLDDIGDKAEVLIFDDGSDNPHPDAYVFNHCGKRKYYQLVTNMFQQLKHEEFDYFVMLPDDIRLKPDFFEKALDHWNLLDDGICLSVGHNHNRHMNPCWTKFKPICLGDVWLTGWNDLCFMATREFLEALNYEIEKPLPTYNYASSGVGRYISRELYKKGYQMYHVSESLCFFPANESKMHI